MAVDFRLAGPGFDASEVLQSFGQARDYQAQQQRQAVLAERERAVLAQQQRQLAARQQGAAQVTSGDFSGARNTALAAGDLDFAKIVGSLEEDQRKALGEEAGLIGSLAVSLKARPPAERAQAFAAIAPQLAARGFDAQKMAQVDLSDGGLDGYIALATSADDALKAYRKSMEPVVLADGSELRSGAGVLLARNEAEEKPIWDAESGQLIYPSAARGGNAPVGGMPAMGGGGPLAGMVAITAQSESGNRNYAPGGGILTSPAGAQAAMQTMPGTQRDPGFGVAPARDESVGEKNRVGRDYLAAMVSRYGDPAKAWAAYNAGPGRVDAAIARGGENWLAAMPAETRAYVAKNVARLSGGRSGAAPGVVQVRAPRTKERDAPSGYRWNGNGLEPIPGGPADPANDKAARRQETDLRKDFSSAPVVKEFAEVRSQYGRMRSLVEDQNRRVQDGGRPAAINDVALTFAYMKILDPTSVVRESEVASVENARGVPDSIRNLYNKARDGTTLTPRQRADILKVASDAYAQKRNVYNERAQQFRGYASQYGVAPERVAPLAIPGSSRGSGGNGGGGLGVGQSTGANGFKITRVK